MSDYQPGITKKTPSAQRFNTGKPRFSLLPSEALLEVIGVLEEGAKKYGADNWRQGLTYKAVVDSIMRHTLAFLAGEDRDEETGKLHAAHIACNALFLCYFQKTLRHDCDDRSGDNA